MRQYLAGLSLGRCLLWCYFWWYLLVVVQYFDASLKLWLTALGLAGIIGVALVISTANGRPVASLGRGPLIRLFIMPFCVSSFAALIKDQGFLLVFYPSILQNLQALALCLLWLGLVLYCRLRQPVVK